MAVTAAERRSWRTPSDYASEKLPRALTDWSGPLGNAIRRFVPYLFGVAPAEVFVGFASNGSRTERTEAGEVGYFGVPEGTWNRLANDSRVMALLGRPAVRADASRAWADAVDDQAAVGLVQIQDHLRGAMGGLPASIDPREPGSPWSVVLAFGGWSAGSGRMAAQVRRYTDRLSRVSERDRFPALLYAVAQDAESGTLPDQDEPQSYVNAGYTMQRTWQKFAAGELLAQRLGRDTSWFSLGMSASERSKLEARITAIGNATVVGDEKAVPSTWGWVLLGAAVGSAGVFAYQKWGGDARRQIARMLPRDAPSQSGRTRRRTRAR